MQHTGLVFMLLQLWLVPGWGP